MADFSFITNAHPNVIEQLYNDYLKDPESIDKEWKAFFAGFDYSLKYDGLSRPATTVPEDLSKEIGVSNLINAFRLRGHLLSSTNPIRRRKNRAPHLDLNDYGLSEADMNRHFRAGDILGLNNATLKEIIQHLKNIYCSNIGFEFAHIENWERRNWLQQKIENRTPLQDYGLSNDRKHRILEKLNGAVMFEEFLHTKFVGQKRFSLEGGETTIPALDAMVDFGTDRGVEEVIIGMAHRGRLNVLANIMGKTYEQIFTEFEGTVLPDQSFGDGDVKYHLGYSSQVKNSSGREVYLKLVPNPSHLEAVNPVVEGFARAKADIMYKSDYDKILPILIHGDAAAAGQGIVYEVVQMSQLEGYYTGGTLHFVINNQIGFTTDFEDGRSSTYCTASANLVHAPVFHVNGDDPEAVVFAVELAVEYRQLFNSDVYIDMVCYRKHGHNEGDDPKFTQPQMYDIIAKHPNPREIYLKQLLSRGDINKEEAQRLENVYWSNLQARLDDVKQKPLPYTYQEPELAWKALRKTFDPKDFLVSPKTGIKKATLEKILKHLQSLPEGFTPLSKVNRLLKSKDELLSSGSMDWALAELSAYGSILLEGKDVRMSGQDVRRGTFSHRHATFRDAETFDTYNRLTGLSEDQGRFMIYNSLLSEFAVLGFEYGYSLANPNSLVLWEAQFGDFANGAQTIMDQFITSGETKWQRMSGLVLLLPHGYEGQGPEHSSARLERFLSMCADYNVTVANLTTPANFFHVLRRQLARPFRKPLIVMSPKSLLRHPECVSSINDFVTGNGFREVYDESELTDIKSDKFTKIICCTGKIYYDLLAYRRSNKIKDAAIVRVEQLYPYPKNQIDEILGKYKKARIRWVQEEPANMGALTYIRTLMPEGTEFIARKASASTATGFKKTHDKQQAELMVKAFE
ncbi:MAG: 2-oxoglutarate dehydrogenase E1 component [Saprospiraceae bacterium]|nr:2-oxoglutarate dehydrogenase E1 component [Candidatus Parvibacillus calidus]MBX2937484.1 2-oxoglutarate dehydrogenase E1 component [Saprospiraceae bacterium]MBX7178025.1 2-oxoglutarate dehydrogenase E1 component [Saprospiraceae bacterium]MCB0590882.1 2-oxoglutarate dehydrogenase E1 component [Saprospiraceae bacterium]MCO5284317.1 2-oxoglutarate dehydrogenase E1 component [Saprospiraceae bacterium]